MFFPSKLIENAVTEIAKLPGIGKKTAMRLGLHLFHEPLETTQRLSNALMEMRTKIMNCKYCNNISDKEICDICSAPKRDQSILCIVEDVKDVMAIENTSQYMGLYYVLGGVISAVEGIGPNELPIENLLERIKNLNSKEIIMAFSPTMDGDTTIFFISKKVKEIFIDNSPKITVIARGIPVGGELEYTDEITLGRSLINRNPLE